MSHNYRIYGLHISSSRPLSLLPAQPASHPDLTIQWTTDNSLTPDVSLEWKQILTRELKNRNGITFWRADNKDGTFTKLRYDTESAFIDFLLDPSKQTLWIIHDERESQNDLQSYLVGPAMGCVLRIRGNVCLHASVVNIDGHAVAIMGNKKAGKSTNAASLAQFGAPVLSDDMAVLTRQDNTFIVHPGYPQVRLWQSSIEALYGENQSLPKVYTHRDKRYVHLGVDGNTEGTFWTKPLPLAAIYFLGELNELDSIPFIKEISPKMKLMTLVQNTFGSYVVTDDLRQKEFEVLAQITKTIPIRCLMFGHDLSTLPAQSKIIIEDFRKQIRALV